MNFRAKTVKESIVETVHIIRPSDLNDAGRLFGGVLMQWIDEVAALVAKRHSQMNVTTASVDNLQFLHGAFQRDVIVIIGRVTHVGHTSTADQDLYVNYLKDRKDVVIERNKLGDQYFMDYYKKSDVPSERMPELMNMVHQVKALGRKLNAKTLDLMKANGSSLVSVYVGDALLKGNFSVFTESEIDAIHDLVDPLLLSSPMGEKFEEAVAQAKVLAKGKRYTDINLVDLKGNQVRLSEFMKEGQCNMLEFWASWCSPCRGEIPHLRRVYGLCEKDNFNMISVSIDQNDADWKKAVKEENMEWTQLCDPNGFQGECNRVYHLNGVPFCLIFDREGKIVCGGVRGIELDVALKDLLGDKLKL